MQDFHYNYIENRYGDTLMYKIETENVLQR